MVDLLDLLDVRSAIEAAGVDTSSNDFEAIYTKIVQRGEDLASLQLSLENGIHEFFSQLELPDHVCLYDELLTTLRAKDLIATFNWDPFLMHAYARNRSHMPLPRLLFLHGNVAIGVCHRCRVKGMRWEGCRRCGRPFEPSKLLFPVAEKDYESEAFIAAEWSVFREFIEEAYLFTIFGYSAPKTDAAARQAMFEVWQANPSRELAEVLIIDIEDEEVLKAKWQEFFVREHYGISDSIEGAWQLRHPRRSCDAFAMATLQVRPCSENMMPRFRELRDLHEWMAPLVEEERRMYEDGQPLSC